MPLNTIRCIAIQNIIMHRNKIWCDVSQFDMIQKLTSFYLYPHCPLTGITAAWWRPSKTNITRKAEYLFEALLFWLVVLVEHKTCSLIETSTVTRSDTGWINAGRQICQPINLNKTGLILFTDIVIGVQTSLFSKLYFIYTKITTWWCHNWICLHHCKSNIIQWLNHCN